MFFYSFTSAHFISAIISLIVNYLTRNDNDVCFLPCQGLAVPGESTRFFLNDVSGDFLFKTTGLFFSNIYGPTFFMETMICDFEFLFR